MLEVDPEKVAKMNEIELRFFNAYLDELNRFNKDADYANNYPYYLFYIKPQEVIGIYKVDFVYNDCVIEIDGHESHKTKEQREYDYTRERYLMKKGYHIIRFMGTEVFLDTHKCVMEVIEIANHFKKNEEAVWGSGYKAAYKELECSESAGWW